MLGQDRPNHKYIRKITTPSGRIRYIYADDEQGTAVEHQEDIDLPGAMGRTTSYRVHHVGEDGVTLENKTTGKIAHLTASQFNHLAAGGINKVRRPGEKIPYAQGKRTKAAKSSGLEMTAGQLMQGQEGGSALDRQATSREKGKVPVATPGTAGTPIATNRQGTPAAPRQSFAAGNRGMEVLRNRMQGRKAALMQLDNPDVQKDPALWREVHAKAQKYTDQVNEIGASMEGFKPLPALSHQVLFAPHSEGGANFVPRSKSVIRGREVEQGSLLTEARYHELLGTKPPVPPVPPKPPTPPKGKPPTKKDVPAQPPAQPPTKKDVPAQPPTKKDAPTQPPSKKDVPAQPPTQPPNKKDVPAQPRGKAPQAASDSLSAATGKVSVALAKHFHNDASKEALRKEFEGDPSPLGRVAHAVMSGKMPPGQVAFLADRMFSGEDHEAQATAFLARLEEALPKQKERVRTVPKGMEQHEHRFLEEVGKTGNVSKMLVQMPDGRLVKAEYALGKYQVTPLDAPDDATSIPAGDLRQHLRSMRTPVSEKPAESPPEQPSEDKPSAPLQDIATLKANHRKLLEKTGGSAVTWTIKEHKQILESAKKLAEQDDIYTKVTKNLETSLGAKMETAYKKMVDGFGPASKWNDKHKEQVVRAATALSQQAGLPAASRDLYRQIAETHAVTKAPFQDVKEEYGDLVHEVSAEEDGTHTAFLPPGWVSTHPDGTKGEGVSSHDPEAVKHFFENAEKLAPGENWSEEHIKEWEGSSKSLNAHEGIQVKADAATQAPTQAKADPPAAESKPAAADVRPPAESVPESTSDGLPEFRADHPVHQLHREERRLLQNALRASPDRERALDDASEDTQSRLLQQAYAHAYIEPSAEEHALNKELAEEQERYRTGLEAQEKKLGRGLTQQEIAVHIKASRKREDAIAERQAPHEEARTAEMARRLDARAAEKVVNAAPSDQVPKHLVHSLQNEEKKQLFRDEYLDGASRESREMYKEVLALPPQERKGKIAALLERAHNLKTARQELAFPDRDKLVDQLPGGFGLLSEFSPAAYKELPAQDRDALIGVQEQGKHHVSDEAFHGATPHSLSVTEFSKLQETRREDLERLMQLQFDQGKRVKSQNGYRLSPVEASQVDIRRANIEYKAAEESFAAERSSENKERAQKAFKALQDAHASHSKLVQELIGHQKEIESLVKDLRSERNKAKAAERKAGAGNATHMAAYVLRGGKVSNSAARLPDPGDLRTLPTSGLRGLAKHLEEPLKKTEVASFLGGDSGRLRRSDIRNYGEGLVGTHVDEEGKSLIPEMTDDHAFAEGMRSVLVKHIEEELSRREKAPKQKSEWTGPRGFHEYHQNNGGVASRALAEASADHMPIPERVPTSAANHPVMQSFEAPQLLHAARRGDFDLVKRQLSAQDKDALERTLQYEDVKGRDTEEYSDVRSPSAHKRIKGALEWLKHAAGDIGTSAVKALKKHGASLAAALAIGGAFAPGHVEAAQPPSQVTVPSASGVFHSPEMQREVTGRQEEDQKRYGAFMRKGNDIINRTHPNRLADSRAAIAHILQGGNPKDTMVIDIGSALGNKSEKMAGVTVKEMVADPRLASVSAIVATDIPEQHQAWRKKYSAENEPIKTEEVPMTFSTPVKNIVEKYGNPGTVILQTANSIDLLMNEQETHEHFAHIGKELKDKQVFYLFNRHILSKPRGGGTFKVVGDINNAGFDHRGHSWTKPHGDPFTMREDIHVKAPETALLHDATPAATHPLANDTPAAPQLSLPAEPARSARGVEVESLPATPTLPAEPVRSARGVEVESLPATPTLPAEPVRPLSPSDSGSPAEGGAAALAAAAALALRRRKAEGAPTTVEPEGTPSREVRQAAQRAAAKASRAAAHVGESVPVEPQATEVPSPSILEQPAPPTPQPAPQPTARPSRAEQKASRVAAHAKKKEDPELPESAVQPEPPPVPEQPAPPQPAPTPQPAPQPAPPAPVAAKPAAPTKPAKSSVVRRPAPNQHAAPFRGMVPDTTVHPTRTPEPPAPRPVPEQPQVSGTTPVLDSSNPELRKEERAHAREVATSWRDTLAKFREPEKVPEASSEPKKIKSYGKPEEPVAKAVTVELSWTERLAQIRRGTV